MHKWKGKEILFLYSGVLFNLSVICYYKYAYFFSENISYFIELPFNINKFILPVGISFYTFQQIAFLVDCYHDKKVSYNLHEYSLFVTFFPQLIAGPIVHHKDLVPQLINLGKHKFNTAMASVGLSIFIVGIFKKLVLADNFAPIANRVFDSFSQGVSTDLITAWLGVLGYSLQLYFDFSAYSDMAIGLGLIFGIKLPINFNSPYKATSIIDFWRRWHITLSQFLRDYVYFSLGGNRKGTSRRYINLMLTMLIGGLWHGAGWGFIVWGGLHGGYLVINHFYIHLCNSYRRFKLTKKTGFILTFFSVVVAWVFFRAESLNAGYLMINSMFGLNEVVFYQQWFLNDILFIAIGLLMVTVLPNTLEIFKYKGVNNQDHYDLSVLFFGKTILFSNCIYMIVFGFICAISLMHMPKQTVFIYFNF